MHKSEGKPAIVPLIQYHAYTAAARGTVLVRQALVVQRVGPALIPIPGHAGSCWLWPVEHALVTAIERQ